MAVGTGPYGVAVGDFNGDGHADLAVANTDSNTVSILLGNGSGGFTPASGSPVAVGTTPVLCGRWRLQWRRHRGSGSDKFHQ